jgi:hypothetical protein
MIQKKFKGTAFFEGGVAEGAGIRTGQTPEWKQMKQEDMPWQMTARYTGEELQSLYQFLQSL